VDAEGQSRDLASARNSELGHFHVGYRKIRTLLLLLCLKDSAIAVGEDEKLATPGIAWRFPITQNCVVLHHYDINSRRAFRERIRRDTSQRAGGSGVIRRVPQVNYLEMARYTEPWSFNIFGVTIVEKT
jgi:hypothetical protein